MYKAGADIGGTKINVGILNENNELVINKKIKIRDIKNLCDDIYAILCEMCTEAGISYSEIISFGVGVPGTVTEDKKRLIKAPNIEILSENTAFELEQKLKIPTALIQDSRAAAWGEYICGGGKGAKTLICFTLGTGIGTGIVIDGKIYDGALGQSGEIGHIPICPDGRECGCGQRGCLEKYCAGGGLDITAKEVLGKSKTSADLFEEAKKGNKIAIGEIEKAVKKLGNAIVGAVNLLSPDCILFSGGLSNQDELYINPVIEYVRAHCYKTDRLPIMKIAELGENAPLVGAALADIPKKRKPMISASIMCADILNFKQALDDIKDAGIEYIHCDIMDNHFVPNLMLPTELLNKLRRYSPLCFDYHIMAENPQSVIEKLEMNSGDIISVHYESTVHLQSAVTAIKQKGARASVALNPSTPIEVLSQILPQLDMVLVMSVNPGFSGQKIVPGAFEKIRAMREYLDERGYCDVIIQVDGNCSFENVPKMYESGADMFVVGTSSVFGKDLTVKEGTKKLLSLLNQ